MNEKEIADKAENINVDKETVDKFKGNLPSLSGESNEYTRCGCGTYAHEKKEEPFADNEIISKVTGKLLFRTTCTKCSECGSYYSEYEYGDCGSIG